MKRNLFLRTCVTAAAVLSSPVSLIANTVKRRNERSAFKVYAGKDRFNKSMHLFDGDSFDCKVSTTDTAGDIYVFESKRIKEGGPAHHYHFEQDEWWYVLQGEFIFKVGDITYQAKAGDSIFGPRMVPHSFSKVGEGEARLLMFFQPAGRMEEYFEKVSKGLLKDMSPSDQDKLREEHGFKRVGPPINDSKKPA